MNMNGTSVESPAQPPTPWDAEILHCRTGSCPDLNGPAGWDYLMRSAVGFPAPYVTTRDRDQWYRFYVSFAETFGCKSCSDDMLLYIQQHPIDLTSRATLFRWVWQFHNYVNQKLGKPFYPLELAVQRYIVQPSAVPATGSYSITSALADPSSPASHNETETMHAPETAPSLSHEPHESQLTEPDARDMASKQSVYILLGLVVVGSFAIGWLVGNRRAKRKCNLETLEEADVKYVDVDEAEMQ